MIALCVSLQWGFAEKTPHLLPFQARLADQNGGAVSNGVRLVQFQIFDAPVGGAPIWAGELHLTTVNGGLVNVILGTKRPFAGVDFGQQLFLEITVDINGDNAISTDDPPMRPRQAILPVIFASEAADSRQLNGHDWSAIFGGNDPTQPIPASKIEDQSITLRKLAKEVATQLVPSGAIVPFAGVGVPEGWLLCDGSELTRAAHPALYNALQNTWGSRDGNSVFNLPDLRGVFLRGVDTRTSEEGGRDPDNQSRYVNRPGGSFTYVGSLQDDAFQGHRHNLYMGSWGISTPNFDNNWLVFANNLADRGDNFVRDPVSDGKHQAPRVASETRPKNAYVNYIIKD